jgi:hypothetical protein
MKNIYWFLSVQITRWVSDSEPGIVECRFTDRFGREWSIIEKAPVVSSARIWRDSQFPRPTWIACSVISRGLDDTGHEIAEITTLVPWGIEATDGTSNFQVFGHQLAAEAPAVV